MRWLLISILLGAVTLADAAEIEQLNVEREKGEIQVESVIIIDAPRALVFAALSDYDQFASLSDRYKESRYIESAADGTQRIYTEIEGCVWFYCRSIERTATLELSPVEKIIATVEAEASDLKYGREEWTLSSLSATDERTRVVYTHVMLPDFWVPPVLGVWAIRKALENDALGAAQRIEQLALEQGTGPDAGGPAPQ